MKDAGYFEQLLTREWLTPTIIFIVCWTLDTRQVFRLRDEPHYLMVCQSLWADGDLDLRNNYSNDDGRLFGAAGLEMGLHARASLDGSLPHDGRAGVSDADHVVATAISSISSNRF